MRWPRLKFGCAASVTHAGGVRGLGRSRHTTIPDGYADGQELHLALVHAGLLCLASIIIGGSFANLLLVQRMKTVGAAAIARSFTKAETASASIFVATVMMVLSLMGLQHQCIRNIPIPVAKSIQVGAGFSLVLRAGPALLRPQGWTLPTRADNRPWVGLLVGHPLAILALAGISGMESMTPDAGPIRTETVQHQGRSVLIVDQPLPAEFLQAVRTDAGLLIMELMLSPLLSW